jgi:hypothetical protein
MVVASARRLLLAALASVACVSGAAGAQLAIPSWAYGLLPANSGQDPKYVTALPKDVRTGDMASNAYFIRWCARANNKRCDALVCGVSCAHARAPLFVYAVRLQCSSLVQWCTPTEVRPTRTRRASAHNNTDEMCDSSCSSLLRARVCSQVYSKCTYEPKGTWFRGTLFINAPQSWPYAPPHRTLPSLSHKAPPSRTQSHSATHTP